MNSSIDRTIATAIKLYLSAQIGSGTSARSFIRLDGFSALTYRHLLDLLAEQDNTIAGRAIVIRSIAPIEGHPGATMESDRSATWYRNTLPAGQTLLLILNRRTSDAQSLKDLFAVGEQTLTRDGITHLIQASFAAFQLSAPQIRELTQFTDRLRRMRLEPQLRDLTEFLHIVDASLSEHAGQSLEEAICDALPALNLFRCRELAAHLNTPRGDKIIRMLKEAAQIGAEILDPRPRQELLDRLAKATFADDSAFGGLNPAEKSRLLRRFIDDLLNDDRAELLRALSIDWREVQQVISARTRIAKTERFHKVAEQLKLAAEQAGLVSNDVSEIIENLNEGSEPDTEAVERLLSDSGDSFDKLLRNNLRALVRPRTRRSADFLIGLTAVVIDLLYPQQETLAPGIQLQVSLAPQTLERLNQLQEAAAIFRSMYGGIEQALPAVQWNIQRLWAIAAPAQEEEAETNEERIALAEITFRVAVIGGPRDELATADLIWQYRSDSPTAATVQALAAENARLSAEDLGPLFGDTSPRLRVPLYNTCQPIDEIGDLDLRYPLGTLGAWYQQTGDLRASLEAEFKRRARPAVWEHIDTRLGDLERAWATFIIGTRDGLLHADVPALLQAYESFLATALTHLQTGIEIATSYRLFNQAWMIRPSDDATWAIMPLLHTLKLIWWSERTRFIDALIARLLDPADSVAIIDVRRFQHELEATYGSSNFPPVIALPQHSGKPAIRFLPADEAGGYELYFADDSSDEAFGVDTDLLADDENEFATRRMVEGIIAIVHDYIETYPFVRDGIEILLFECRNGALPGMLIEQLTRSGKQRSWPMRITVIVHTSERGAPLFRRVSKWVAAGNPGAERQGQAYFPPIIVKVLECDPANIFNQKEDTDIVVLADVLAKRGHRIGAELEPITYAPPPVQGYLPTYHARQEPFQDGEQYRRILLTAPRQPGIVNSFLLAQYAALERRAPRSAHEARFYRELSLEDWKDEIERLHDRFNWVICYDISIDRFLLQATFPERVKVIRYSLGLGAKRQHNLTVSSSGRSLNIVTRRLAARLGQMFPQAPDDFCYEVAERLVAEAIAISGDIVLRAAGPGAFLNELIGLVAAKFETERAYLAQHPDALCTWILLDDFEHWFGGGKFPDLLFVAIHRTTTGELALNTQVLEAKCVGELSFDSEATDAEEQVRRGVGRLSQAFAPDHTHLDALYWYDQLYRALAGNLLVTPAQQPLWELLRDHLHDGAFQLDLSGHAWVFCHDGQAHITNGIAEQSFDRLSPDAPTISLRAHHYGRNELAGLLRELIQARGGPEAPPEVWAQPLFNTSPNPPTAKPIVPIVETTLPIPVAQLSPMPTLSDPTDEQPGQTEIFDRERQWIADKARELERALRQRGVQLQRIDPANADIGPSVVRFKVRLAANESLRKIQNVAEDLARDLALASTPLIDNVFRTNFVGVDIPREHTQLIALRPLLDRLSAPEAAALPIIIGVAPDGAMIVEDLAEFPHLLVAGATNSGKSVFLRSLLLSLITQYQPGTLELLIVDPKRTDFTFFGNLPYLRGNKVLIERNEARDALLELVHHEMPRRQSLIAHRSMRIKEFNQRFPAEALPPIVALIDEYALLVSMMDKKERESFEQDLMILAAAARSVGIHLVLATQRPSADILTSTLKANLDARIAFRVASSLNSRVVLDTAGAENLLGRGDMLFRRQSGEITRLQAPFMGELDMQAYLVDRQHRQGAPNQT